MVDLVDLLLKRTHLHTKLFHQGQHCGHWQFPPITEDLAVFHLILRGQCEFTLSGESSIHTLYEGDLLFIACAHQHVIQSIEFKDGELESHQEFDFIGDLRQDSTGLICGTFEFEEKVRNPLLDALPSFVIVRADFHSDRNWISHLVALLVAESNHSSLGSNILIERLTDTLFTHIVRSYLSSNSEKTRIFAAYTDRDLRKVLEAIHKAPERAWSLDDLTTISNLSRSAFIERFTQTFEQTPMAYLTQLRMGMAYHFLKNQDKKVLDVALTCGYQSEAAFCRAFKRLYNMTPTDVRLGFS